MHQSIATIDSPEFINLQPLDINPLMSKCEIKVLYLGENRNRSFISKEVATEMAKTLRGAPIVGYYKENKEDFADHGEKVTFEGGEITFECMTKPYGFVAPDAQVWFQKFDDKDDFGNIVTREYLMTTGYLWTGQFEEAKLAVDEGRPQSMEIDEKTLEGKWTVNSNNGMEFFIINDAIFSKLCILGEDVEPCFEGSSVTAPNVSTSFTLDNDFKHTLFTMMQELKFALEGGQKMDKIENPVIEQPVVTDEAEKNFTETSDNFEKEVNTKNENPIEDKNSAEEGQTSGENTDFVKDDDKKEDDSTKENKDETETDNKDKDEKDKKDEEKYSLLEAQFNELTSKFEALTEECEALKKYKADIEDAQKDELINSFYMLDDSEKKDIKDNKSKFSLDEIEAKLSVLYTRKTRVAEAEKQRAQEADSVSDSVTTYSLADDMKDLPDWVKAVHAVEEKMNF